MGFSCEQQTFIIKKGQTEKQQEPIGDLGVNLAVVILFVSCCYSLFSFPLPT